MTAPTTLVGTLTATLALQRSRAGVDHVRFDLDVAKKTKDGGYTHMTFTVVARDDLARHIAASGLQPKDRLIVHGTIAETTRRLSSGQPVRAVELLCTEAAPSLRYVSIR